MVTGLELSFGYQAVIIIVKTAKTLKHGIKIVVYHLILILSLKYVTS